MKKLISSVLITVAFLFAATAQSATLNRTYVPMPDGAVNDICLKNLAPMKDKKLIFYSETRDTVTYDMLDYVCPFHITAEDFRLTQDVKSFNLKLQGTSNGKTWAYDITFTKHRTGMYTMSHWKSNRIPQTKEVHDQFLQMHNEIAKIFY